MSFQVNLSHATLNAKQRISRVLPSNEEITAHDRENPNTRILNKRGKVNIMQREEFFRGNDLILSLGVILHNPLLKWHILGLFSKFCF